METDVSEINKFLFRPNAVAQNGKEIYNIISSFVEHNDDPRSSPNFASRGADDVCGLFYLLSNPNVLTNAPFLLVTLKALKILMRKPTNRKNIDDSFTKALVSILGLVSGAAMVAVLKEACNVVLNICYESENVIRLVRFDGVGPLTFIIGNCGSDVELLIAALGALQVAVVF